MERLFQVAKVAALCLILAPGVSAQRRSGGHGRGKSPAGRAAAKGKYVPVLKYDPTRDAERDVRDALAEARRTGRRVLLKVGGEWCVWCHIMDDYLRKNPSLLALTEKNFVTVKINFSEENENRRLLSRYPEIPGYPHFFVLGADRKLLHSQDTSELEEGKGYNLDKFTAFLNEWAPPAAKRSRASIKVRAPSGAIYQ